MDSKIKISKEKETKGELCYILSNGDFPSDELLQNHLAKAPYLLCCDGAVRIADLFGLEPDAIVGDGDSLTPEMSQKYADRIHIIAEQETNDLTKTVNFALESGFTSIVIFGATGLREDHTLANISLLMDFHAKCQNIKMVSDYGVFVPLTADAKLPVKVGQQVSIFNFSCTRLSATGLKYPLRPFARLWEGSLNEATADELSIAADGDYLVYLSTN